MSYLIHEEGRLHKVDHPILFPCFLRSSIQLSIASLRGDFYIVHLPHRYNSYLASYLKETKNIQIRYSKIILFKHSLFTLWYRESNIYSLTFYYSQLDKTYFIFNTLWVFSKSLTHIRAEVICFVHLLYWALYVL